MATYDENRSQRVIGFLQEYKKLCQQHQLCFSHEDGHGGFLVHDLNEDDIDWALQAADDTGEQQ